MRRSVAMIMERSNWWNEVTVLEAWLFQIHEPVLCMPFSTFHAFTERILGRPVLTHEFAHPELLIREHEWRDSRHAV